MEERPQEQGTIKDVTAATFRIDVIAESARQPVLVDFWAPWCGPCKQLTPILEKVVRASGGKIKLTKMNIDEHPQIAGQLGIQSIPAVFAFQKGQPVDGFMGALPESQVKAFVERLVGPLGADNDALMQEATEALGNQNAAEASALFSQALAEDPENLPAIAGLATALVMLGDLEGARNALSKAPKGTEGDSAMASARAALENAEQAESVGDLAELERQVSADPKNHQAKFEIGRAHV